ncbi:hypothetical protein ACEPAI_9574 [Sanghuangporus weigelae]
MADAGAQIPALDNTMGVLYLGVTLAMALWGASCVQTYYYYNHYPDDAPWMKSLVAVVWTLDTVHQGLITHSVYKYLITEYGNLVYLNTIVETLLVEIYFEALVVLLVQAFFILRVWRLSEKNIPLAVILVALSISSFALSVVFTVKGHQLKTFSRLKEIYALNRSINVINAVTDVSIAAALIYLLNKSRTGFRRSNHIINHLIFYSLNTGLLTSIDAIGSLVGNVVWGDTFIYIFFFVNISRLYTNSFLATLNTRKGIHGIDENSNGQSFSVSQSRFHSRAVELEAPSAQRGTNNQAALSIKVNTETVTMQDREEGNVKHSTQNADLDDDSFLYTDSKPCALPIHRIGLQNPRSR